MTGWTIWYGIAIAQGVFITGVLLLIKRGNQKANRVLAALIALLTLYLLDILLGLNAFFESHPHFLHITTPLWYLFPPLGLLYVYNLTGSKLKLSWKDGLHLLPFLLMLYQFIPFYLLSGPTKLDYYHGVLSPPAGDILRAIYVLLSPMQISLYSILIFRKLSKEQQRGEAYPAHIAWLKLLAGLLLLFGLEEWVQLTRWLITGEIWVPFKFIPLTVFSIIIYAIAYLAIAQPEFIFPPINGKPKRTSGEGLAEQAEKLRQLMETEKLYLNADLKYSDLATRLGISARALTDLLSHGIGQSFSDFVNSYRVKEVQARLKDSDAARMTLLAISLEAGFNSKATFNRIFKKLTGQTPSEYQSAPAKQV